MFKVAMLNTNKVYSGHVIYLPWLHWPCYIQTMFTVAMLYTTHVYSRVGPLINETKCQLDLFSFLLNQTKWHLVLSSLN